MISVRIATPDEIQDAESISRAAFSELRRVYRPTKAASARQADRQQDGIRLVAKVEGHIVGTLLYFVEEDRIDVSGIAVAPNHRRRGAARELIEFVAQTARSLGVGTIAARTVKETANVAVFERLGFRVVAEELATWCVSDEYPTLHDVLLERQVR